ncbi:MULTISPECIES: hypothetical protein [Empedobacter]|uniref:hypothetical protein n=1 Tax=Empedobacter TaxID=59734 RepID=UPI002577337F|nr:MULTISPECIES: hypothetical protein [Empedobacter]MDM1043055.1 hypothetical protein [Empedobacter brevis]MDM1136978.1 hypothetical protein [Empedobacter sp. R750]
MFTELEKYKTNGHFFFEKNDNLRNKSKDVPNLPGVYYILKLAKGKVELVYIGKSGSMLQNGQFKDQLLNKRLNNKQDGIRREYYFLNKIEEENIEALDIYWFVTVDDEHNDLPGYVEGLLLQRYFEVYGCLPPWNKSF